jgi:hypothetical protein
MEGGIVSDNTAGSNGGGVYINEEFTMQDGEVSGNSAGRSGGGVYLGRGTFTKTGGTINGGAEATGLKNSAKSNQGHAVYQTSGPQWRNGTVGPAMNPDTYGFWLND